MDKSTHEVRLAHWKEVVAQCQARPEGMTASAWLEENGIPNKQYYYWLRKVRRAAYEELKTNSLPAAGTAPALSFTEIPVPEQPSAQPVAVSSFTPDAVICVAGAAVALSNNASSELIGKVMEAVRNAC